MPICQTKCKNRQTTTLRSSLFVMPLKTQNLHIYRKCGCGQGWEFVHAGQIWGSLEGTKRWLAKESGLPGCWQTIGIPLRSSWKSDNLQLTTSKMYLSIIVILMRPMSSAPLIHKETAVTQVIPTMLIWKSIGRSSQDPANL